MAYGQKILKGDAYKRAAIKRRHIRIRKNVSGTAERPRLVVTRSNRHIVAQVIDDLKGHTLASASTLDASVRGGEGDKSSQAKQVGALVGVEAQRIGRREGQQPGAAVAEVEPDQRLRPQVDRLGAVDLPRGLGQRPQRHPPPDGSVVRRHHLPDALAGRRLRE